MSVLYQSFSEDELLRAIKKDDILAFEEIYRRYWRKLYQEAFKRFADMEACEELLQDVFTDFWLKRHKNTVKQLYPYLYSSVRYNVYALYKKKNSLPKFEQPMEYMAQSEQETEGIVSVKQLTFFVEKWLSAQPEKRKEIFRLKFFEEMSTLEISKRLKVSQNTVQNQLNTAFKNLRITMSKFVSLLF